MRFLRLVSPECDLVCCECSLAFPCILVFLSIACTRCTQHLKVEKTLGGLQVAADRPEAEIYEEVRAIVEKKTKKATKADKQM